MGCYRGAEGSTLNVLIGWRLRAGGDEGIYDVCSPRVSASVNVRRIAKYLRKFTIKQRIIIVVGSLTTRLTTTRSSGCTLAKVTSVSKGERFRSLVRILTLCGKR
jgi:hypothetical protein